ncbi:VCBS domain-containing protein [Alcaligenes sp. 13f]|uniref:Ig-like domain-containing protein n=1 Tax=Alcaligenes sp. 13f TaxID=2841924 RepID=UPI001CF6569A|nr:Ig-like domain-containing protein [Alcaligenes sp. 13f]MCB4324068.1 VCBS domain-containing protein [Alcaligenes sp. 13f]
MNAQASLSSSIIYEDQAPVTDEDTKFDLFGISVGSGLVNLNIGSGHPLVEFELGESTNSTTFDIGISGLLDIGVLGSYAVIVERQENGQWVRPDDLGEKFNQGILKLDLLNLFGTEGSFTLDNLPAGAYRATLVPDPALISVGVAITRNISVSATDKVPQEIISVDQVAEGNFISQSVSGGEPDTLKVTSVTINGQEHPLTPGTPLELEGEHGKLVITEQGAYTYTPNAQAGNQGTDSFVVTLTDLDGTSHSANLIIDVSIDAGLPEIEYGESVVPGFGEVLTDHGWENPDENPWKYADANQLTEWNQSQLIEGDRVFGVSSDVVGVFAVTPRGELEENALANGAKLVLDIAWNNGELAEKGIGESTVFQVIVGGVVYATVTTPTNANGPAIGEPASIVYENGASGNLVALAAPLSEQNGQSPTESHEWSAWEIELPAISGSTDLVLRWEVKGSDVPGDTTSDDLFIKNVELLPVLDGLVSEAVMLPEHFELATETGASLLEPSGVDALEGIELQESDANEGEATVDLSFLAQEQNSFGVQESTDMAETALDSLAIEVDVVDTQALDDEYSDLV